jgi:hypothetical protein
MDSGRPSADGYVPLVCPSSADPWDHVEKPCSYPGEDVTCVSQQELKGWF